MTGVVMIEFEKPARFLNLNDRDHWRKKAELTRHWRLACRFAAYTQGVECGVRALVSVDLPVRSINQRRDPSNLYPTIKACIDGLVDARVWPDDDSRYVVTEEPTFHQGGNTVIVTITEMAL